MTADPRPAVVIGVGNPYRRDDGVGLAVIRALRERGCPHATLAESDGETAALITMWHGHRLAILVDAIHAEPAHPGRVHRLLVPDPGALRRPAVSSHDLGLGEAVRLAVQLERMPDRMVLYGVEVTDTDFGVGLSDPVRAVVPGIVDAIARELQDVP